MQNPTKSSNNGLKRAKRTLEKPFIQSATPITKKCRLKCGSLMEVDDGYLDGINRNNEKLKLKKMELAMQFISNDRSVGCTTVQALGNFNSQSLATPAKKKNN